MDAIEAVRDGRGDQAVQASPPTVKVQGAVEASGANGEDMTRQEFNERGGAQQGTGVRLRPPQHSDFQAETPVGQAGHVVFGSARMSVVDVRSVDGRLAAERTEFEARLIEVDPEAEPTDRRMPLDKESFRLPPFVSRAVATSAYAAFDASVPSTHSASG